MRKKRRNWKKITQFNKVEVLRQRFLKQKLTTVRSKTSRKNPNNHQNKQIINLKLNRRHKNPFQNRNKTLKL